MALDGVPTSTSGVWFIHTSLQQVVDMNYYVNYIGFFDQFWTQIVIT